MEDTVIDLTFRRNDFEEIYYPNSNENLFGYPPTKKISFRILLIAIFGILIYFLSINYPMLSWLLLIGIFASAIYIYQLFVQGSKYYSWKNGVDKYLKELSST